MQLTVRVPYLFPLHSFKYVFELRGVCFIKLLSHIFAGHVARVVEMRNAYGIVGWKPKGKKTLGRPIRRWENNIRVHLSEVWWEGVDWTHLAQDRDKWQAVVNTITNIRFPQKAGNLLAS
jgi:hypothetical protein